MLRRGDWVSLSGQYYRVPDLMLEPHPRTPAPILCGGESEAALNDIGSGDVERFREPVERFAENVIAKVRT